MAVFTSPKSKIQDELSYILAEAGAESFIVKSAEKAGGFVSGWIVSAGGRI